MDQPLGMVLKGFKAGCNKAFRELGYAATVLLQREPQRGGTQTKGAQTRKTGGAKARKAGFLFARNYNDHILEGVGELERWFQYLHDTRTMSATQSYGGVYYKR